MKKLLLLIVVGVMTMSFNINTSFLPTSLKITVLNSLGNPVNEAEVRLYGSEDDYRNEENQLSEAQNTNEKGQVTFKKLEAKVYFVHVVKGEMNNDGGGAQTDTLQVGRLNKVNIVIE